MKILVKILCILALLGGGAYAGKRILDMQRGESVAAHGEEAPAADYERGPHGGRMLRDGDFAVEVTIYEPDIPPQSRVYPFLKNQPLDPASVTLRMELHRFGSRVDDFTYVKEGEYLMGNRVVEEPHSFVVKVIAEHAGRKSAWEYDSFEGRVGMSVKAMETGGISIETAGPAKLRTLLSLNGKIAVDPDKVAHVAPRYPSIILEARKKLGDRVQKGEVLAVLENNETLQPYEMRSQVAGRVLHRDAVLGESVGPETTLYVVGDLETVLVDIAVPRESFASLREGQKVVISDSHGLRGEAVITYLSPIGVENTQTMLARAELPNPESKWQPSLYVGAEVVVGETEVPVAVKESALQTFREWDVVFMNDGTLFEIAILELGRRDDGWVEVVSGLAAGTRYATENSFVVKADVLKSGASHDH